MANFPHYQLHTGVSSADRFSLTVNGAPIDKVRSFKIRGGVGYATKYEKAPQ